MSTFLLAAATTPEAWPPPGGSALRSFVAALFVVALVAGCAWLLKRGHFATAWRRKQQAVTVERAVPLGDRRSLAIVTVEGRRLLLGLTPVQVSLLTELSPGPRDFGQALDRSLDGEKGNPK